VKPIRFIATDPQIDIEVPVGNLGAQLVGGLGGYQEIERQDDVSLTDWSGQEALKQDISVLLDGYAKGDSVERELNTILKLGRDPNGERVPPVFKVFGPVYYEGKSWVLPADGIDLSGGEIETIRRSGNGELLRQEVILHLLEFIPPEQIRLRSKKKSKTPQHQRGEPARTGGTAFPGKSYTVREGETLISIAAKLYGTWEAWKAIGDLNGIADPHRKLPAGKVLKLP
jgi:LysM repeat protein